MIDRAVKWAIQMANDNTHGYDQANRWGPDYDCSSLVISAWEQAGVPVKSKGGATYTGNMKKAFIANGFKVVQGLNTTTCGGLQYGDVLLHEKNHTAMYIGGGKIVQASINERGGITGGQSGDQTGGEIHVRSYYNYPWDCVLRYTGDSSAVDTSDTKGGDTMAHCTVTIPQLKMGDKGSAVLSLQNLLLHKWGGKLPTYGADGDFGSETYKAVIAFQGAKGLDADGIVGPATWKAIIG